MSRPVYVTATGAFLPNEPVDNASMERFLGLVDGRPSKLRERILRANGIRSRHYALDEDGCTTHLNEQLAAEAVMATLGDRGIGIDAVDMLALGTTQGDVPVPGFSSMVHGRLSGPPMEILSAGGVCCSGMAALGAAWRAVAAGHHDRAVAGASELVSRALTAKRFERESEGSVDPSYRDFDADFLRWMLSDGAGALLLETAPHPHRPSLRVDWVELTSHAGRLPTCMYSGLSEKDEPRAGNTWLDAKSLADAERRGLMNLRQDTKLLEQIVPVGGEAYLRLVQRERFRPEQIDHVLCHYSSHFFRQRIFDWLDASGVMIPEQRWFTNLYDKGNTGAASIFIMLEECMRLGRFTPGDRVLLVVPESGRFSVAFAQLTCVGPGERDRARSTPEPARDAIALAPPPGPRPGQTVTNPTDPSRPTVATGPDPAMRRLDVELGLVWTDLERWLRAVPLVQRVERGEATLTDYRNLLRQLRQQVVDGARWIARAASHLSIEHASLRARFLEHAVAEQHDYRLLEQDFEAVGGERDAMLATDKNVGSEALSAFVFHRASQADPLDLLGTMFVIEGLGGHKALAWAEALSTQLALRPDQTRFLRYHAAHDGDHLGALRTALAESIARDPTLGPRIVKTARVTARLYALQLEEMDRG